MYAIAGNVISGDTANYLQGYQEGVTNLVERLSNGGVTLGRQLTTSAFSDGASTWGLQATKVVSSRYSGSGIKVESNFVFSVELIRFCSRWGLRQKQ